eukprot:m.874026 g.874026  ORF g.874026 m.874026 type:complete len:138 (-) comp23573_c0_seq5:3684-4097(-)
MAVVSSEPDDLLDFTEDGEEDHAQGSGAVSFGTSVVDNNEGDVDDVDLYADLVVTGVAENSESTVEAQKRADAAEASVKDLTRKLETAKKLVDVLKTQNAALKRNISCLFKTAKLEMDRKDAEIQRLRALCGPEGKS